MDANIRLGLSIRPKVWFGYGEGQGGKGARGQEGKGAREETVGQASVPAEANSSVGSTSPTKTENPETSSAPEVLPLQLPVIPPLEQNSNSEFADQPPSLEQNQHNTSKDEVEAETSARQTAEAETSALQIENQKSEAESQSNQDKLPEIPDLASDQSQTPEVLATSATVGTSTTTVQNSEIRNPNSETIDFSEAKQREIERRESELERLKQYGINEEDVAARESEKGDWISRDKAELERKIRERKQKGAKAEELDLPSSEAKGLWRRSIESFAINLDVSFDARDYLRKLDSGENFFDILKLPDDSDKRSSSTIGSRYGFRTDIDPFTWSSFGTSYRRSNDFTKSAGTASRYKSETYEGDVKLFNSDNSSSIQLRYSFSDNSRTSVTGTSISKSISHEPSLSWRQSWGGTKTSTGVRFTLRNQTRSGVKSHSMIITPNFSIDYKLLVKGEWRMPVLNKVINLDHNFDLTNTFSTVVRREQYGVNRDEKSERFETSLRFNYNLSTRLRMNTNLGISYNKDHVEEGRDYFSVAGSVMVRGEFR
jgi:hypothetical protein